MANDARTPENSPRRRFLQTALSSAAIAAVARAGIELAVPEPLDAQTKLSPDASFQKLLAGNERFASGKLSSTSEDLRAMRDQTRDKQEPFAAVLSCSDSRVPVELIFDQTIGKIFVARLAGNIVTPEVIASLEYAVAVLGVTSLLVLGHSSCGAVKAALNVSTVPGQISALYLHIGHAIEQSGGNLSKAIELNAKIQADLLRNTSTVIRDAVQSGKLQVGAGVYDLASGKVAVV